VEERKTSIKVDGKICGTLCSERDSIKKYCEVKATRLYEIHPVVNVSRIKRYRKPVKE